MRCNQVLVYVNFTMLYDFKLSILAICLKFMSSINCLIHCVQMGKTIPMASGEEYRFGNEGDPGEGQLAAELPSEGLPNAAETDERGRDIHVLREYVSVRACGICKKWNSSNSEYVDGMTMLVCDQCGREYHVACLKGSGMNDLHELPEDEWFCEEDCKSIDDLMTQLVASGPETLSESNMRQLLDSRQQQRGARFPEIAESSCPIYGWQILCGKAGSTSNVKTLVETVNMFIECLDPIRDVKNGRNLIPQMVHSKRSKDYDFEGLFCIVLKLNEKVVSAALLQVFGREIAEIPLVATSLPHRDQGFCSALMTTIERLLGILEVKHLVLPAPKSAKSIWINKFGFSQMEDEQLSTICSSLPLLTFTGMDMLEKPIVQIQF